MRVEVYQEQIPDHYVGGVGVTIRAKKGQGHTVRLIKDALQEASRTREWGEVELIEATDADED